MTNSRPCGCGHTMWDHVFGTGLCRLCWPSTARCWAFRPDERGEPAAAVVLAEIDRPRVTYRQCGGYVADCPCGWSQHHSGIESARADGERHQREWHGDESRLFP